MKNILRLTIFSSAILVASNFANAAGEQLNIKKRPLNFKEIANQAETEKRTAAKNMHQVYDEPQQMESQEVLNFVEAEMGHKEASEVSQRPRVAPVPN